MNARNGTDMPLAEAVKLVMTRRRSVRQFSDERLSQPVLNDILEAAIYAPSASNAQNQRFLVLTKKDELRRLGAARFVWPYNNAEDVREKNPSGLIGRAAAAVVVFADAAYTDTRPTGEYYIWESVEVQNCAASIENMLNMAAALGLGSCWLSAAESMSHTRMLTHRSWAEVFADYDVPATYKIQGIVILGHPKARTDEYGFPRGERKHGASFWATTQRKPLGSYLIGKRTLDSDGRKAAGRLDMLCLQILGGLSRFLVRIVHRINFRIYELEVKKILAERYQDENGRQA